LTADKLVLAWTDAVLEIVEMLADVPGGIWLVGGAVRDALLRRPITDIDLATDSGGVRLGRRIANQLGGAFYPLDIERDLGRVITTWQGERLIIDVSGLRAADLEYDLALRDFTINAMAVDVHGDLQQVIDPLGGVQDVIAKRLRQCADNALASDPIRVLRAARLSVQFGLRIDGGTLRAMRDVAPHLSTVSPERYRDEVVKMLSLPRSVTALRVADAIGALDAHFPRLRALHGLKQGKPHIYDAWEHTLAVMSALSDILATISYRRTDDTAAQFNLGMIVVAFDLFRPALIAHLEKPGADERARQAALLLAALLHDVGKGIVPMQPGRSGGQYYPGHEAAGAEEALECMVRLRFSNQERDLVAGLVRHHGEDILWRDEPLEALDIYRYWRMMGEDGIDLILLCLADYLGTMGHTYEQATWLRLVENGQLLLSAWFNERARYVDPPPLINGDELRRALALKPGPIVGMLLERIREAQVRDQITTVEQALATARAHMETD
jgi:tRNA nucleotidyltransferase/poly(A) polymerase